MSEKSRDTVPLSRMYVKAGSKSYVLYFSILTFYITDFNKVSNIFKLESEFLFFKQ